MINAGAMATTADADVADFAYAPMQMQPYVGFDHGLAMPTDRPPLLQHHLYDDNLDFASPSFPFQEPAPPLFSGAGAPVGLQPLALQMAMPMAPSPSPLQMPMMTMPSVPAPADVYPFGAGGLVKREDGPLVDVGGGRIGLNLGRRTYFSPADALAVDRLLMRSRLGGVGAMGMLGLGLGASPHHHHQPPRCQAEGCKADLSGAKHYHRRHKVCEYHSKAATVAAGGKQQRFCQQCSRFQVLAEFDEAKRSCRKRLTEHNRRRRKPASAAAQAREAPPPPSKKLGTGITSSYTSDHKTASTTAAMTTTAFSPKASGVSCLELDNGQAAAAPTTLSLAAPPHGAEDGGLTDTVVMMQQVPAGREDDDQQPEERFVMMTSFAQEARQHNSSGSNDDEDGGSANGNILSCSSVSDHHQQNSRSHIGSMHFFGVDFM